MTERIRGWIGYDAECAICRGWAARTHKLLLSHGFHFVPLQSPWAREKFDLKEGAPIEEMKLFTADGRILGGADALIRIARSIWWAWPIYPIAQIPGIKQLLRVLYRWLARNRHCFGNQCRVPAPRPKVHRHITSTFYDIP